MGDYEYLPPWPLWWIEGDFNFVWQFNCFFMTADSHGQIYQWYRIYHYIIWSYSTFDTRETTLIFITWQSKVSYRHRMNDLWNSQTWYHHCSDDLMLTHSFWSWFVGSSLITREPVDISWGNPAPPRHALHEVKGILTRVLTHTTGNKISSPQLAVRKALLTLSSRWAHHVVLLQK